MGNDTQLLERLGKLIAALDEQVTKKDFTDSLQVIFALILKMEERNGGALSDLGQAFKEIMTQAKQSHETSLAEIRGQVDHLFVAKRLAAIEEALTGRVDAKLATVKNGKPGTPGAPGAPGRPGRPGKDAVMTPELRAELDALKEDVQALRNRPVGGGGGVTNMRIIQAFKYILKTEQPTGTIDGVNTTFTVTQPIFAVLSMSLNGETIAQLPNYTIQGKSITFSSPLPAAYSGKDFEIKYI